MWHENGLQATTGPNLLQHAEWITAAAALHGNDIAPILSVDTAKGIRELPRLLFSPDRATHSSTTTGFTANA
jgi:hypothetical protein